jgi:hypothetical protein
MSTMTEPKMATGAQANFILTLQGVAKDCDNRPEAALAICETMTVKEASALIDQLKKAKPVQVEVIAPKFEVTKNQWHELDGHIFKVAQSQSTGKLYAKKRLEEGGFDFAAGAVWKLSEATLLQAETAAAWGHSHSRCVFCYTPIDTPESTTAGYGPDCAKNQGLPWGGKL